MNLSFEADDEMDYTNLMRQLHRQFGEDVQMRDFRTFVEVLGESGAGAVKEILENYSTWQLVLKKDSTFVDK